MPRLPYPDTRHWFDGKMSAGQRLCWLGPTHDCEHPDPCPDRASPRGAEGWRHSCPAIGLSGSRLRSGARRAVPRAGRAEPRLTRRALPPVIRALAQDGINVATYARHLRPIIPLLIVSGYAGKFTSRLATLQPAPAFTRKLYDLSEIVTAVNRLTSGS